MHIDDFGQFDIAHFQKRALLNNGQGVVDAVCSQDGISHHGSIFAARGAAVFCHQVFIF